MGLGRGALRASLRVGLAAGALMLAVGAPVQAQWFGFRYGYSLDDYEPYSYYSPYRYRPPVVDDEIRPAEIVASLRARGFSSISRPVYGEDVATVRAVNPNGRPVRLTIDIYTGRIIGRDFTPAERQPVPPRVVQRAPEQGPTIRRTVPEPTAPARAAPEEREPEVKREPVVPRQATPPAPPRNERIVRPERPAAAPKPPEAAVPGSVGSGTRTQPRRIEIAPPAPLDAPAAPAPAPKPAEPPINSVPPAALE
jgi:hypothetical protein